MSPVHCRSLLCGLILTFAVVGTNAHARCRERVVVLPVDKVAAGRHEASAAETALRAAAERALPECVRPRTEAIQRLKAEGGSLPVCVDDGCRSAWVEKLGGKWVLQSVALAVGGKQTLAISLWGGRGESGRRVVQLGADPEVLRRAVEELWTTRTPRVTAPPDLGVLPHVSLGVGIAALGTGIVLGLASQQAAASLSTGAAGCPAEAFSSCFQQRLALGRSQAFWGNALMGAGAAIAGAGAVTLVWTLP